MLGLLGAKRESPPLLRAYNGTLTLLLLAIAIFAGQLLAAGPEALSRWLDAHWEEVQQRMFDGTPRDSSLLPALALFLPALLLLCFSLPISPSPFF